MLWITMRNRLTTRDRLRFWSLDVPSTCFLCDSAPENKTHLFFDCTYSSEVWNSFFTHQALSPPSLFVDIVRWVRSSTNNGKLKTICNLILQAVVYFIWKERNARLHTSSSKPAQLLVKEIQVLLRAKLYSLDRTKY